VSCEEVRAQLPDYALGTLPDLDRGAIRAHLRGCSSCRAEAARLDEGLALFSTAAHEVSPPPELEHRVLSVLGEEWAETPSERRPRQALRRRLSLAAAAVIIVGLGAWGALAQLSANRNAEDAAGYRFVLETLGGQDVRVTRLASRADSGVEGSAILYDSTREQSWALVLVRAPGYRGQLLAKLIGPHGRTLEPFPIELEDGNGSTWLVTSMDISQFELVRVTTADGTVVAQGVAGHAH
jgi:hypothetical protein